MKKISEFYGISKSSAVILVIVMSGILAVGVWVGASALGLSSNSQWDKFGSYKKFILESNELRDDTEIAPREPLTITSRIPGFCEYGSSSVCVEYVITASKTCDAYVEVNIKDINGVIVDYGNSYVPGMTDGSVARFQISSFDRNAYTFEVTKLSC